MKNLLDSDVLIDAIKRRSDALRVLKTLSDDGVAISVVSYGELLDGASRLRDASRQRADVEGFLKPFLTLLVDREVMDRFAWIRADLRSRGRLITDFDIVIAATAIEHDLRLITRNRKHFARIPGLRFNSPEEVLGE